LASFPPILVELSATIPDITSSVKGTGLMLVEWLKC
jgi:hypothetical protein